MCVTEYANINWLYRSIHQVKQNQIKIIFFVDLITKVNILKLIKEWMNLGENEYNPFPWEKTKRGKEKRARKEKNSWAK